MTNELANLLTSVVLGTLLVGYGYFASLIATVERHDREREESGRRHFKPVQ
ncbi:hypothetical protein [Phyllobacterium endophyticum]|uniref:hypothetical protein n=1 Tax=Phyllobacterium endophyticum TaxID=1149773 RepID=UPI0014728AD1|nr:hypothetical protein [Phyllobacterium endophyticum]MBB3238182.1 hypothetical protein [Phyllobacterium endophyticum]